ncbi:thioester reductase domain-containing protein [Micromonospora sp. WMMA1363]|uniref:type I polyketide synthase n=1 Tax=Micromonospora sp. WMMA1363 TaxID=3053985 RepID=UPI00259CDD55|nr:type I polyketide synthase [Micromonospora sp. WMMA1363]MDM4719460.1 thioester reductase domain-containing protein [Micromonospora sp. WMMA1363]
MRTELIRPLSELLSGHAVRLGDKVAFADDRHGVSYHDLALRTSRLAGHLAAMGLDTGARAAILMGNSVEAVESCLAVIRAGGIAVPLNPQASGAELAHVLADAEPTVVLCDPARLDQVTRALPTRRTARIILTADSVPTEQAPPGTASYEALVATEPTGPVPDEAPLDDPAWLLYTSGTTGHPKGVLYSLRSSLWLVASCHVPVLGLSEQDRLLWPMPLFHGLGQNLCVMGVTAVGASARLMNGFAAEAVRDALHEERVTFLAGVPTTYHYLLDHAADGAVDLPGLRLGFVAGSASSAALGARFEEAFGVPLVDQYGSTETGAITSNWPSGQRVPGSVGPPVPGVSIRLVEPESGRDVPAGDQGEVWVSGPNLMLGYHRQPEATAAVLRDGWYRTGDLARRDALGHLTLTGRLKELIIRGGENIHPAEIEAVLREVAGVADVAVGAEPHDVLGEVPVAYVVPGPAGVDAEVLFAHCRQRLSYFKVPDRLYTVERVPRTASGKVTRHLLAAAGPRLLGVATAVDGSPDETGRAGPAEAGEWARRLRGMSAGERARTALDLVRTEVAHALGREGPEQVPPDQPFVDLGLGSLAVVAVGRRLCTAVGLRLAATVVFDHPTPAALAARLVAELTGSARPPARHAVPAAGRATRSATDEPIAIVGMACRFPGGVADPEQFWTLLAEGRDVTSDFPDDRGWALATLVDPDPDRLGTSYVSRGGFLSDPAGFDAAFFGISPREATAMDPQQRLLLEIVWEALERAGVDPTRLAGSPTGVFVGTKGQTYSSLAAPASEYEGYLGFATSGSVMSGRVAYTLGLEGPAITVDTACSASLVALHLACESLRSGESRLALAGGVTVMATPDDMITFSRQRGLAPDGRVKAFAAAADGTAFGEGAGVLLLERLTDARQAGHEVLAVIRGSAVNQDGASNGLTAPNGQSQQRLIRQALATARLAPTDIDLVEAHGTGTALGDPIEAEAILATYGQGRSPERPLWLGSVKSNITHTQAAAGIAGVIKTVQAMRHGTLPATLNVDQPSPHVDWTSGQVHLLTERRPWTTNGRPRRAGVSAFGISGTNAHVILEESPATPVGNDGDDARTPAVVPWLLSARSPAALRAQAARLATFVRSTPEHSPVAVGRALARSRAGLEHRAAVVGGDTEHLLGGLRALASGEPAAGLTTGLAAPARTVAVLFTGQGAQYQGMARDLHAGFEVFAAALDEVCRHLAPEVRQALLAPYDRDDERVHQTGLAQPALFALEVAQFALLRSWGVAPDALAGHSVGELAAAHVAGVLSLTDAARLVTARGCLMQALPPGGAMAAVKATEEELLPLLAGQESRLGIAAVNAPGSVVVSGDEDAVTTLADTLADRGHRTKRLTVSHAFHSPRMDAVLDEFHAVARSLTYHPPVVPIVSTVTGAPAGEELLTPEYWVGQLRNTVRFAPAVGVMRAQGTDAFVEVGPDGVLTALVRENLGDDGHQALPVARRGRPGAETAVAVLGALHTLGVTVDWEAFFSGTGTQEVTLPTYAFQRKRYWLPPTAVTASTSAAAGRDPVDTAGSARHSATAPAERSTVTALAAHLAGLDEEKQLLYLVEQVGIRVAAVLGHTDANEIDPDAPLTDLGFDSLTAVELRNQIGDFSGVSLRATLVFEHPTVAVLADHLLTRVLREARAGDGADGADDPVDFAAEATLAADIVCADEVVPVAVEPREVLLTGATGFLGAFLLRDLMRTTHAVVHCLVRAADEKEALGRLRDNLRWYEFLDEIDPSRLSVVVGDLAAPRFGLSEERFDDLARRVDVVYHAAATVNGLYPYSALKAANVSGTEEVLRLAARFRTVPVHHVSSTGVFAAEAVPGVALKPTDPLGPAEALSSGYRQTKLVAEQVIDVARGRGLPVSVYRVDEISGDSDRGRCQTHDFVWLSMKGIVQAGAVPAEPAGIFHLVPVDYVSAAILRLSGDAAAANRNHHIANGVHLSFADMTASLRAFGYRLDEVGWDSWVKRVRSDRDNAMVPMIDGFESTIYTGRNHYLRVDTSETRALLAGTGVDCPPMTRELFEKYVDFFVRVGYFPPPGADRADTAAAVGLRVREATTDDLPQLTRICYDAFNAMNMSLGLPPEWSSEQAVSEMLQGRLASPSCLCHVAVDQSGSVVGSNFLVLGESVGALGPLSVATGAQGGGAGRMLMESLIAAGHRLGTPSMRGVQVTNNLRGYRLYSSLGFVPREQLSVMVGYAPPTPGTMSGFEVRPMAEADVAACQELYRTVNGHPRDSEIHMAAKHAFSWSAPYIVVDRATGEVAGYTTGLSDFGHLTAVSEAAARALYAGAGELMRRTDPHGPAPRLRIPGRLFPDLLGWAARTRGLALLRLETLISLGAYSTPTAGVYCPGLSY